MKKFEISAVLNEACKQGLHCRMFLKADPNCYSCFPVRTGEDLFIYMEEQDFRLDGYVIRRVKDIVEISSKVDLTDEILKSEGVINEVKDVDIDVSTWEGILSYLSSHKLNAIFESESRDSGMMDYAIGRIEKKDDRYLYVRAFDADGNWEEKPTRIAFSELSSISWGTRYVDIFSKYLPPCPIEHDISLLPKD